MKLNWIEPSIKIENFQPDEYVAACVVGTIACAIPGDSADICDGNYPTRFFRQNRYWGENYVIADNLEHGVCGNDATISFNGSTGSGYEFVNGVADSNRPIFNIVGYEERQGRYNVTWQSRDMTEPDVTYTHYGVLKVTNVIDNRPNHS